MQRLPTRFRTSSRACTSDHVWTTAAAVCETRFPARSIAAARAHAGLPVGRGARQPQRQRSRVMQEGARRRLVLPWAGSARGALVAPPRAAAPTIALASGWTESVTRTLVCPVGHTGTRSLVSTAPSCRVDGGAVDERDVVYTVRPLWNVLRGTAPVSCSLHCQVVAPLCAPDAAVTCNFRRGFDRDCSLIRLRRTGWVSLRVRMSGKVPSSASTPGRCCR